MQPETKKLLFDMYESARSIQQFVAGKELADVQRDDQLRSAIYFKFVIIGEALTQIRQREADISEQITESWRIIGFRNQITHGYGKLDDEVTWRIIDQKLPKLVNELKLLLGL